MKKKLHIKVGDIKQSLNEFKAVWENAEKGKAPKTAQASLFFENTLMLLKTLTPKRLALMQHLHANGACSIRTLAKQLKRDYKNVHSDIKILHQRDLVLAEDNLYYVPWDVIKTEIPLDSEAA